MELSLREFWTCIHGMVLGATYLLAFTGGLVCLWNLRPQKLATPDDQTGSGFMIVGLWAMAIFVWLTVIVGTYVVYPWYRAKPPANTTGTALAQYPKFLLVSSPKTKEWHEFGMEWKEHVAWLAPILATVVAFVVSRYRRQIVNDPRLRQSLLILYGVAFFAAAAAGLFGAMLNKMAATH